MKLTLLNTSSHLGTKKVWIQHRIVSEGYWCFHLASKSVVDTAVIAHLFDLTRRLGGRWSSANENTIMPLSLTPFLVLLFLFAIVVLRDMRPHLLVSRFLPGLWVAPRDDNKGVLCHRHACR